MLKYIFVVAVLTLNINIFLSCKAAPKNNKETTTNTVIIQDTVFNKAIKTIHIFVALCDNKYQGIQPVPVAIGNGKQPASNLYWGCSLGIKSYFKASKNWTLIKTIANKDTVILERLIFKHNTTNTYLIADAFDGEGLSYKHPHCLG